MPVSHLHLPLESCTCVSVPRGGVPVALAVTLLLRALATVAEQSLSPFVEIKSP